MHRTEHCFEYVLCTDRREPQRRRSSAGPGAVRCTGPGWPFADWGEKAWQVALYVRVSTVRQAKADFAIPSTSRMSWRAVGSTGSRWRRSMSNGRLGDRTTAAGVSADDGGCDAQALPLEAIMVHSRSRSSATGHGLHYERMLRQGGAPNWFPSPAGDRRRKRPVAEDRFR